MNRQSRTLAILAALAAVCLGGCFALRAWNQSQEAASHTYLAQLTGLTHLSVDREGQTLAFTCGEDGTWTYDGDGDFPVSSAMLEDVAEDLAGLEAVRVIQSPEELSSYGLDNPRRTVTAQGETGSVTLLLGNDVEESDVYAMVEGSGVVYTIASDLLEHTDYTLLQLAQTETISAFHEDDIQQVTLSQEGQTVTLTVSSRTETQQTGEVDENGAAVAEEVTVYTWYRDGQELPQDSQGVETLLACLGLHSFGDCLAFKPSQQELEEMGLGASALVLQVTGTDGESLELSLGRLASQDGEVYARKGDSLLVFALDQSLRTDLESLLTADWTVTAAED